MYEILLSSTSNYQFCNKCGQFFDSQYLHFCNPPQYFSGELRFTTYSVDDKLDKIIELLEEIKRKLG